MEKKKRRARPDFEQDISCRVLPQLYISQSNRTEELEVCNCHCRQVA